MCLFWQRVIEKPNKVVVTERMWGRLLCSTNQPSFLDRKSDVFEDDDKGEEAQVEFVITGEYPGRGDHC